ncbi:27452_t:CDS:1, partial [Racocetra persica]
EEIIRSYLPTSDKDNDWTDNSSGLHTIAKLSKENRKSRFKK